MKKNRTMSVAALLLGLTLITSCFVGGTFAKYVTVESASDTARVAAWGFGDASNLSLDLFDDVYGDTVDSSDDENVIAPGAEKEWTLQFVYADTTGKGAPEVDYTIDLNVLENETAIGAGIEANTSILWSFNGADYGTWDDMIADINDYHEEVEAGALPTIETTGVTVGWKWVFETDPLNDVNDTALGDAAALEEVTLAIELVATQVTDA